MSKKKPYREHHLIQLLEAYEQQKLPLDLHISNYFRNHKALGSKDRAYIAETTYFLIRWLGLIDYVIGDEPTWDQRLDILSHFDWKSYQSHEDIPAHIRVSFPEPLYQLFLENYGSSHTSELCLISNTAAPTTVRINTLKTTASEMLKLWQNQYEVEPCKWAANGITF